LDEWGFKQFDGSLGRAPIKVFKALAPQKREYGPMGAHSYSNAFRLSLRCHSTGVLALKAKTYAVLAIVLLTVGGVLFFMVSLPPSERPPRPIVIGAGPCPEATFNKTEVEVDVPSSSLDVCVAFRFNETQTYFIYVLLPYKVLNTTAYGIYQGGLYPHQLGQGEPDIGNFSTHQLFNASTDYSILNASLAGNPSFHWAFGYPDMKVELTLGVTIKTEDSLVAISYPFRASQSVALTFFGQYSSIMSSEMYAFEEPRSQITMGYPFIVKVKAPSSTYFSNSQPSPIQYYIEQGDRWLMFSLDFIEGRYFQTLFCTFTYPTGQSLKEIMVFIGGAFVALSTSLWVEAFKSRGENKKPDSSKSDDHTETQKPQRKRASKTIDLLKIQIYADRSHTKLTSLLSFLFAYFIGLMVLFYTVLYQGLGPSPVTTWVVGLIGTAVSTIGFLIYVLWDYYEDVRAISRMIEAVREGKPLPELEKLSRKNPSAQ
jgi:hypothetical protein